MLKKIMICVSAVALHTAAIATDQKDEKQLVSCFSSQQKINPKLVDLLPQDMIDNHIIPTIGLKSIQLNRAIFEKVTGFKAEDMFKNGFDHAPTGSRIYLNEQRKEINFKKLTRSLDNIPSFVLYNYVTHFNNPPQNLWKYLKDAQIESFFTENADSNKSLICKENVENLSLILKQPKLYRFELNGYNLTEENVKCIAEALSAASRLEYLYLTKDSISNEGILMLSEAIKNSSLNSSLRILSLSRNLASLQAAKELMENLKTSKIITLSLDTIKIKNEGVWDLFKSFKNTRIKIFHLGDNSISKETSTKLTKEGLKFDFKFIVYS